MHYVECRIEMLIQLATYKSATPWFNIPAQATDNYARQFATMVKQQLNPALSSTLNILTRLGSAFSQTKYIQAQGQELGFSVDPTLAGAYYTAYRSSQIFDFSLSFWSVDANGPVIASQAANPGFPTRRLDFRNAFGNADALAIAPYFNCSDTAAGGFGILGDPATASQVDAMTVDGVIDIELAHINGCVLQQTRSNSAVARSTAWRWSAIKVGNRWSATTARKTTARSPQYSRLRIEPRG